MHALVHVKISSNIVRNDGLENNVSSSESNYQVQKITLES